MTPQEFIRATRDLFTFKGFTLGEGGAEMWAKYFKDISEDTLRAAVERWVGTEPRPPALSQLLSACKQRASARKPEPLSKQERWELRFKYWRDGKATVVEKRNGKMLLYRIPLAQALEVDRVIRFGVEQPVWRDKMAILGEHLAP